MECIAVGVIVRRTHCRAAADGVGCNYVVAVVVDGRHLLGFVHQQQRYPVGNCSVEVLYLVHPDQRVEIGIHHLVRTQTGPVCVVGGHPAPVHNLLLCIRNAFRRGAVACQQQCVALLLQLGDDIVYNMAVGVCKSGGQIRTCLNLVADDQIIALAGGVDALRYGVHASVGTACRKGGIGHRVDGLHSICQTVIHILHRSDIHIGVLPHVVGAVAGADAFGSLERVVALVLVVVGRMDGDGKRCGGVDIEILAGESAAAHTYIGTHHHRGLAAEGEAEIDAELEVECRSIAIRILRACLDKGRRAAARRVAQHVEQLDGSVGRGDGSCPGNAVSCHIAPQGLQLDIFPFALHREVEHTAHILIVADKRHIVDGNGKNGLPQAVEFFGDNLGVGCIVHPIIHLQRAALNAHLVMLAVRVVVVIVVLMGIGAEVVVAGEEHRRAEEVAVGSVAVLRGKGHVDWRVLDIGPLKEQLSKVVQLHAIAQLLARDVDGAAVGELVFGIVKGVMVVTLVAHGVLAPGGVAEVDGLA